jgi:predicted nucleic-acid-binding protein
MASNCCGSLDTNVILRYILQDIPEQCAKIDKRVHTCDTFHIADIAIIEICFVLSRYYKYSREDVLVAMDNLFNTKNFNFNRNMLRGALRAFVSNSQLSFEDCCLAEYAMANNALPLWTFDRDLAKKSEYAQELK